MSITEFNDNARNIAPVFDTPSLNRRAGELGVQLIDFSAIKDDIPPLECVTQYPTEFKAGVALADLPRADLSCIHLMPSAGVYRDAMICKEGLAQYAQSLKSGLDIAAAMMASPSAAIAPQSAASSALADQFSIATLALQPNAPEIAQAPASASAPSFNRLGNG